MWLNFKSSPFDIGVLFTEEDYFSDFIMLVACSCLCWTEFSWALHNHVSMSSIIYSIQVLFRQPYSWTFIGLTSMLLWDAASQQAPWLSIPDLFRRCIHWDWTPKLKILIGCGFYNGLGLLQTEDILMRGEYYIYLWV